MPLSSVTNYIRDILYLFRILLVQEKSENMPATEITIHQNYFKAIGLRLCRIRFNEENY